MSILRRSRLFPLCLALAGCAAMPPEMPVVPARLKVESTAAPALKAYGDGVQSYVCEPARGDLTQYEWTLKAADSELFDANGGHFGRLSAGPTWEAADGSRVTGVVRSRAPSPTGALPWFLFEAQAASGSGVLGQVKYIQQLYTVDGAAPTDDCAPDRIGQQRLVRYRATYYFYRER